MFKQETEDLKEYLISSNIIDFHSEIIQSTAEALSKPFLSEIEYVKKVYEYVRDEFPHSFDIGGTEVACSASDVIKYGHGICYAKSHLLAALLRCSNIPAGFCYQRLQLSEAIPKLVLHGLNAIYLSSIGRWVRVDARGNKEGVDAQFSIYTERLAFQVRPEIGETDGYFIYAAPLENAVAALSKSKNTEELINNLPNDG